MLTLGLTDAELRAYHRELASPLLGQRVMRVRIGIHDANEKILSDVGDEVRILEGAVQVDTTQDVSRLLQMTLADPENHLMFDPSAPSWTALGMDRFISVIREDYVPEISQWVGCPVFFGPITRVVQNGWIIQVEALGKESLLLAPAVMWRSKNYSRNRKITHVIRDVLELRGERKIRMPSLGLKIRKKMSINGMTEGWKFIQPLARQLDRLAMFEGDGYFNLRNPSNKPVFSFRLGENVIGRPLEPTDFTTVRNLVQIRGPKPKHGKKIVETARAPRNDPLSAQSLQRTGRPRYLVERIEDEHARKRKPTRQKARKELSKMLRVGGDFSFEALPVPHLEEMDVVRLITEAGDHDFRLKQFTIPLTTQPMSINVLTRSRAQRRTRR